VFDRLHIERYSTEAIDEVRKREFLRRGIYRDANRGKQAAAECGRGRSWADGQRSALTIATKAAAHRLANRG